MWYGCFEIAAVKMSYGSDQGMLDFLAETGRVLPSGASVSVARYWGSLYCDQFEHMYRGTALQDGASFPRDLWPVVPQAVERAAYEAGYAWADGVAIFGGGGTAGGQITKEKLDVIEVTYAAPQDGSGYWENNVFILPAAYALLLPFMFRKGRFFPSAMVV